MVNKVMTASNDMGPVSLTVEQRKEVCRLYNSGDISQGELAKQFGVTKKYIHHCIQAGKRNRPRRKNVNAGQRGLIQVTQTNKAVKKKVRSMNAEKNSDLFVWKADGSCIVVPKLSNHDIDKIVHDS
jgi:predicted DNA-binding protein YlxM (UPF0122 family)